DYYCAIGHSSGQVLF
nr:immunoglobulin light chain junction region [Macaca mulatta]MOX17216.1 immunoglobulin light chain junction region [Macaca mulatta]MOX17615.1 immunoglobulin light chain junction region [Macaca mulatta]MOX17741.1 immunoglobulin light chain junction region [Macaca mulatta]MOX17958.1 immunoglobulin light chain junction region [Macaca mulatta]